MMQKKPKQNTENTQCLLLLAILGQMHSKVFRLFEPNKLVVKLAQEIQNNPNRPAFKLTQTERSDPLLFLLTVMS